MSNKNIYESAFMLLKEKKIFEDKLSDIGVNFEYGNGAIGSFMESIVNNTDTIIQESLGLHIITIPTRCKIMGASYGIDLDIFCQEDENLDWAMTCDDFYNFLYNAIMSEKVRELAWKAFVERDVEAKEKFNALKSFGKIGYTAPKEEE